MQQDTEATVELQTQDLDNNNARMNFSMISTMETPVRVHPPGATGLKLEFGSMGSTKAENLLKTGEVLSRKGKTDRKFIAAF